MSNSVIKQYRSLYRALADRYCRLLLIIGDSRSREEFMRRIAGWHNILSIGRMLAVVLYHLPAEERTKAVLDFFDGLKPENDTLFLSDIEILFDGSLNIRPVELLKSAAKNLMLVVDWPGGADLSADMLFYAEPGHSEYLFTGLSEDILWLDVSGFNSFNNIF